MMLEPKFVTYLEVPGPGEDFGTFKVKGLEKTIFRFEFDQDGSVKVDNGSAFLLDALNAPEGKVIYLPLLEERAKQYEADIQLLIDLGEYGVKV